MALSAHLRDNDSLREHTWKQIHAVNTSWYSRIVIRQACRIPCMSQSLCAKEAKLLSLVQPVSWAIVASYARRVFQPSTKGRGRDRKERRACEHCAASAMSPP